VLHFSSGACLLCSCLFYVLTHHGQLDFILLYRSHSYTIPTYVSLADIDLALIYLESGVRFPSLALIARSSAIRLFLVEVARFFRRRLLIKVALSRYISIGQWKTMYP
jgi:hypothetical protein